MNALVSATGSDWTEAFGETEVSGEHEVHRLLYVTKQYAISNAQKQKAEPSQLFSWYKRWMDPVIVLNLPT